MLFTWFARKPAPRRGRPGRPSYHRPRLEQLEDRLVPSTLIPVSSHRDLVFDPYRNVLDITTTGGVLLQFNVMSQTLMPPLSAGTNLTSADITADGSTLFVAEQQSVGGQEVLHRINLNTGQRTDLFYPSQPGEGGWGLALGSGSKGLMDDVVGNNKGPSPMRQFDTVTTAMTFRGDVPGSPGMGAVSSGSTIRRGADRSLLLITEGSASYGPLFTYSPQTDTFSRPYAFGTSLSGALTAVNRNGTLFAVQFNGSTQILTPNFAPVMSLGGIDGGVAFDPAQDLLYGVSSSSGQLLAFDTNTWAVRWGTPVGEAVPRGTALGNGTMTVSPDGRWLFLATPGGVREFQLPFAPWPATKLSVSNLPVMATAGAAVPFTITALDPNGRVATGYLGTVHFISSDPKAVLPPDYHFTPADLGSHTFTVTLKTAGLQMVNAYDPYNSALATQTPPVQVIPGAAAGLQVTTSGTLSPQPAGYSFGVLVTAVDAYNNVANYTGRVHFTSTDKAAVLPADYTFTAADAGAATFSVTFGTTGSQGLTAADGANGLSATLGLLVLTP